MRTKTEMRTFALTVKECELHEVLVEAPDLETAVAIAQQRWVEGDLGIGESGYVTILDEEGDEVEEIAHW